MHIVYCWEMGGGLGHLVPMAMLTQQLKMHGVRVSCILKDLSNAARVLGSNDISWFQAPKLPASYKHPYSINHAELLAGSGFDTPDRLKALCIAWRSLLQTLKPDLLIGDFAPAAVLVGGQMGIPVLQIDSGFSVPPVSSPLPALPDWLNIPVSALVKTEIDVLATINTVMRSMTWSELPSLSALYQAPCIYRNWAEINPFGYHSPSLHAGPIVAEEFGVSPLWPDGQGPQAFAYLKPDNPLSMPVLQAMIAYGYRVCAYLPGFAMKDIQILLSTGRIMVSKEPVKLNELEGADLTVWHSANGAAARCLNKALKMLLLPSHLEQILFAKAVIRAGSPALILEQAPKNWFDVFDEINEMPKIFPLQGKQPANVRYLGESIIAAAESFA